MKEFVLFLPQYHCNLKKRFYNFVKKNDSLTLISILVMGLEIIEIEEPTDITKSQNNNPGEQDIALGIDFGTTNSIVAVSHYGAAKALIDITPTLVAFGSNGQIAFGGGAKQVINSKDWIVVSSVKSLLNKDDSVKNIDIFGKKYNPEQIATLFFKYLKSELELNKVQHSGKAVITVPAYFDDAQRSLVKQCATNAGFEVIRLINEPTAAALAYGIDNSKEGIYAIFDLGGGTFDVSILEMKMGVFKVIATGGDTKLGGDDFDKAFANKCNLNLEESISIKHLLSTVNSVQSQGGNVITREQFDDATLHLTHKAVDIFKLVLSDAKIDAKSLCGVVLVGGSTKMPIVKEAIAHEFTDNIFTDIDPDRAVAFGAAVQAENLTKRNLNTLLLDVTPLSLGIELMGGTVQKIIHRNTSIPFTAFQSFTTYEDNQDAIKITILQGERDLAKDCRTLASFELGNIPRLPAGVPDIVVTFFIDADGILTVSAEEQLTKQKQSVQIRPTFGIDMGDVVSQIDTSMKHAKEDIQAKLLIDQITESSGMIAKIKNHALKYADIYKNYINKEQTELAIKALQEAIDNKDKAQLMACQVELNDAASDFIKQILELEIKQSIKNITNIN